MKSVRLDVLRGALAAVAVVAVTQPAAAQHSHGQHQHGTGQHGTGQHGTGQHGTGQHGTDRHSAYAGMQNRPIKALSEQQVADLRAGKGMSLALPAELNGYPGPSHSLELAEPLKLTAEQRSRTQALFSRMQQEAKVAGESVIEAEAALDRLFRDRGATPEALTGAVSKAAQAQEALRETHLRYHLSMMEVLSAEQVAAYSKLRGY
jgi:Spy/CpxP family protein refolding chaperone